jgi:hypothetical protein
MAKADFTRYPGGNATLLTMPVISIPEDFQCDGRDFRFQISTPHGCVDVWAHWDFRCKGPAKALEAAGILDADWLPGIPGNNKCQQTVMFEEGGPRLRCGRNNTHIKGPHITITRRSRTAYEVIIPATKDQSIFVRGEIERHKRKCQEEKHREALRYKPQSAGEFRQDCCRSFDVALSVTHKRMEEGGFVYTRETMGRINRAFIELRDALADGGIQARPCLQREGNVIFLGRSLA